jgi:hypothetical protein
LYTVENVPERQVSNNMVMSMVLVPTFTNAVDQPVFLRDALEVFLEPAHVLDDTLINLIITFLRGFRHGFALPLAFTPKITIFRVVRLGHVCLYSVC